MCEVKWALLRAWHWTYNISEEGIQQRISQAEKDHAPPDALYRGLQDGTIDWVTLGDIKNPALKKELKQRAREVTKGTVK